MQDLIPMAESILIVDDSTFIVEGLVALLKKSYRPIPAYSGEECLEILRTTTPALIILDIMMEPLDGWETLARIKGNPKTRHIPVLMFSAKKISPAEAEEHRIIIDDFITKPVQPRTLLEAIGKILARQEFNRQILSRWVAAGVSPAVIDEYLTVKMNLDVDVSLLAVMKRQLEFSPGMAANREDIERSILALESRIGEGRSRIETFCRERAGTVPVPGGEPGVDGDASGNGAGSSPPASSEDDGPGPDLTPVPVAIPDGPDGATALPGPVVPAGPVPGPAGDLPVMAAGPAEPVEREEPRLPPGPVAVLHPVPAPIPERENPGSGDALPGPAALRAEERVPGPVPEIPPVQPETDSVLHFPPGEPSPLFEPFPLSGDPPGGTAAELRRTLPNDPDALQPRRSAAVSGGGTATPRMRSFAATSRIEREEAGDRENGPAGTEPPAPSRGLFSRLIAALRGLFARPGR